MFSGGGLSFIATFFEVDLHRLIHLQNMADFDTNRMRLAQLQAQRNAYETEAFAISSDLSSPGPNGEKPAGVKDPLVDTEGFPRSDIDVHAVLEKRNRLSIINTDHRKLMMEIEVLLGKLHSDLPPFASSSSSSSSNSGSNGISGITSTMSTMVTSSQRPFALIDEILEGSPAQLATLENGDLLYEFGAVKYQMGIDAIQQLPDFVKPNLNKAIKLKISRPPNTDIFEVEIIPRSWGGRGVLGCHFSPFKG